MARYNRILFLVNLPSISMIIAIFIIVMLFYVRGSVSIPEIMSEYVIYGVYFCVLYSFAVCLTGSIISGIFVKSHKKHTYIEISDSCLILSEHSTTVYCDKQLQCYKKLWVMDLNDIENVECLTGTIQITGKARYFDQKAEWLAYERTENGVDFDNWWYNVNGGQEVHTVEIRDYYTNGERIAKRIRFCADKVTERTRKREEYRQRMLEIARNTKHKKGISDKYKPPNYRQFR
jgi:hypothetical protein